MLKVVIVDDENKARLNLSRMMETHCDFAKVTGMAESAEAAYNLITEQKPDVVTLDIRLNSVNAFELLARFKRIYFKIIFVTAYSEYAIQAIKISASDYLLKPVDKDELKEALHNVYVQKIKGGLQQEQHYKIPVPIKNGLLFLKSSEIVRLEADGSYTHIFLNNGVKHTASKNMKEFEILLEGNRFFRCHQSHLVNLDCVNGYTQTLEGNFAQLVNGTTVEVSRRKKEEFLAAMRY